MKKSELFLDWCNLAFSDDFITDVKKKIKFLQMFQDAINETKNEMLLEAEDIIPYVDFYRPTKCTFTKVSITSAICQKCDKYIKHEVIRDEHGRNEIYRIKCLKQNELLL